MSPATPAQVLVARVGLVVATLPWLALLPGLHDVRPFAALAFYLIVPGAAVAVHLRLDDLIALAATSVAVSIAAGTLAGSVAVAVGAWSPWLVTALFTVVAVAALVPAAVPTPLEGASS